MFLLLIFLFNFSSIVSCSQNDFKVVSESLKPFEVYGFSEIVGKLLKAKEIRRNEVNSKFEDLNEILRTKVKVTQTPEIILELQKKHKGVNCNNIFLSKFLTFLLTKDFLRHVYHSDNSTITIDEYNTLTNFFYNFFQQIRKGLFNSALSTFVNIVSFFSTGSTGLNCQFSLPKNLNDDYDFCDIDLTPFFEENIKNLFKKISPRELKVCFANFFEKDDLNCWFFFCEKLLIIKDHLEFLQKNINAGEEEPLRILLLCIEKFVTQMGYNEKNFYSEKTPDSLGYDLLAPDDQDGYSSFEEVSVKSESDDLCCLVSE